MVPLSWSLESQGLLKVKQMKLLEPKTLRNKINKIKHPAGGEIEIIALQAKSIGINKTY